VGKASRFFKAAADRTGCAIGVTVKNIDAVFQKAQKNSETLKLELSGPPKEHPWGEKSFLLIDPEGNRWEVTESPSADGMLVPR
jgi:uncharacterized glyoxalase superfamily protein PhnB